MDRLCAVLAVAAGTERNPERPSFHLEEATRAVDVPCPGAHNLQARRPGAALEKHGFELVRRALRRVQIRRMETTARKEGVPGAGVILGTLDERYPGTPDLRRARTRPTGDAAADNSDVDLHQSFG
jgi:hypothetical protein